MASSWRSWRTTRWLEALNRIVSRVWRDGDEVVVTFDAFHCGGLIVGKGAPDHARVRTDREGAKLYFRITGKRHSKLEAALQKLPQKR